MNVANTLFVLGNIYSRGESSMLKRVLEHLGLDYIDVDTQENVQLDARDLPENIDLYNRLVYVRCAPTRKFGETHTYTVINEHVNADSTPTVLAVVAWLQERGVEINKQLKDDAYAITAYVLGEDMEAMGYSKQQIDTFAAMDGHPSTLET
jgi:hypothetical protein